MNELRTCFVCSTYISSSKYLLLVYYKLSKVLKNQIWTTTNIVENHCFVFWFFKPCSAVTRSAKIWFKSEFSISRISSFENTLFSKIMPNFWRTWWIHQLHTLRGVLWVCWFLLFRTQTTSYMKSKYSLIVECIF